jgi:predicted dehydrogenase
VANDSAAVSLRLASGAHGTVHLSSIAHVDDEMPGQEFTIFGTEGTLEGRLSRSGSAIRLITPDEGWRLLPIPERLIGCAPLDQPLKVFTSGSVGPRAWIDAIIEGRGVSPDFEDGWRAQRVIDAALESARSRCWTAV